MILLLCDGLSCVPFIGQNPIGREGENQTGCSRAKNLAGKNGSFRQVRNFRHLSRVPTYSDHSSGGFHRVATGQGKLGSGRNFPDEPMLEFGGEKCEEGVAGVQWDFVFVRPDSFDREDSHETVGQKAGPRFVDGLLSQGSPSHRGTEVSGRFQEDGADDARQDSPCFGRRQQVFVFCDPEQVGHRAFHEEAPGVPKEGFKQVVWKVPADPAGKEKISCFDFPSRIVCPECLYWANADGDSGLVKQFWKGIPVNGKHHPDRWPLLSAVQTKAGQGTGGKGDSKQRWKNLERLEEQVNSFREVFSIRRIFPSRLFGCSEQSVQMAREKTGRSFPDGHGRKDRLSIKESRIEDRNAGFCGGKKCSVVDDQIVHASVPRFSRMVRAFA